MNPHADLITRAYRAGAPLKDIAHAVGATESAVVNIARRHGAPPRRPRRPDLTPRLVALAYAQAGSLRGAALLCHTSIGTVRKRLREASE